MDQVGAEVAKKYSAGFGHKVRELREEQSLSQEKLAELAGLHRTFIGAVERGEKSISLENAGKIAEALRVAIGTLFQV